MQITAIARRSGMIGYWLMPAEPARTWFAEIIQELAGKYDAPIFEPHVTLYAGDDGPAAALDTARRVAANSASVELTVTHVADSENFTKTLFVQFSRSDAAQRLSDDLRAASFESSDYEFDPHLSLLYADISALEKETEAAKIVVPFSRVAFDSVQAVEFPNPIRTRADVESWRVIGQAKLGG